MEAVNELRLIVASDNPDDKWIGMNTLVEYLGDEGVDDALKGLSEGVTHAYAEEDPRKSMVDFCSDTVAKYAKNSKLKVALLNAGNLSQKASQVVRAKVWNHMFGGGAEESRQHGPALTGRDYAGCSESFDACEERSDGSGFDDITAKEKSKAISKEEAASRRFCEGCARSCRARLLRRSTQQLRRSQEEPLTLADLGTEEKVDEQVGRVDTSG